MANNTLLTSAPRTKVLANGAVYDLDRGRIVANPGGGTHAITSVDAREKVRKRWENYRKASARGILKEAMAIDPSVETPADAYALVVGKQYLALVDSDKPKLDDVYKLGQIIGALPNSHEKQPDSAVQAVQAVGDVVRDIAQMSAIWADVLARQVSGDITNIISTDDSQPADSGVERGEG
jgi:hypothetical protein